jgi:glutamate/tyrosine decarboxylase-like PLP-dependent enzyme
MLQLERADREQLWARLMERVERYITSVESYSVTPELAPGKIREELASFDFSQPMTPTGAVDYAADALTKWQVQTPHPKYYGLFNPAPTTMGIAADTLVAAFNPQLAAWSHSPFAVEVERHIINTFAGRFGLPAENAEGTFTSGGMEANHTALLAALTRHFPAFLAHGIRALDAQPVLYLSSESHHSIEKAARLCGLGSDALRRVPVDAELRMRPDALRVAVAEDRRRGFLPFMVVATAGTTNAGVIDPLNEIAQVARDEGLWFHVDAAWGGAAVFVPELRSLLSGVERSDSITFDAHKFLSVPMGAGMFLTPHRILEQTFRVQTAYMPRDAAGLDIVDPHLSSMQWSRRFTGLKVFLSLLVAGWDGYAEAIRHQTSMGELLRTKLRQAGWTIRNVTQLPVVCFTRDGLDNEALLRLCARVVASGEAWISTTILAGTETVLRACITNYQTNPEHIEDLVESLGRALSAER